MTIAEPATSALKTFILAFGDLISQSPDEPRVLSEGARLLKTLIARDDWLPDAFAQPAATGYGQHLLHCDSQARFSIVSFAWGPGQATPIHDHTVWGLVGVLRGGEIAQAYARDATGLRPIGPPQTLRPGDVEAVSPTVGDIHQVTNANPDRTSVSIHVYGADIGQVRRSTYALTGEAKPFVSGYSNARLPNPWGGPPSEEI